MIYLVIALIIIICIMSFFLIRKTYLDIDTKAQNEKLRQEQIHLQADNDLMRNANAELAQIGNNQLKENEVLKSKIDDKKEQLDYFDKLIEDNKNISQQAFEEYWNNLETAYSEAEEDYDTRVNNLKANIQREQAELDKLKATRAAAHEAMLREQEVKDNKDAYRLVPSASDLADSRRLEIVKRELNKPRILCMLIWQTYWQPLAKKQFPLILQDKTKCGIYKITNLITDECYVGQSVDVYKRWNDHCKCGLGIDTPPGNKLYKAIQEYGLDNFTFELLTECKQAELNEKEKYFIELYQADTFGYNSTGGNK